MNTYRNKKTGAEIRTDSKVTGENWELVKKKAAQKPDSGSDEAGKAKEPGK